MDSSKITLLNPDSAPKRKRPVVAPGPEMFKEVPKRKRPMIAPTASTAETVKLRPGEKLLSEIEALVEEAKKKASGGASSKEVTDLFNEKIVPKLSLYGAEYLYAGEASEMSDTYFEEIREAYQEAETKRRAKRKEDLDEYEETLRKRQKEREETVKEKEEVKKEAKKSAKVSSTQASAEFVSPDMFELYIEAIIGDKKKAKEIADELRRKYPGKRGKFYGRKRINFKVEN
jgi:F0F1-type ATP synthase assembly protein I